jgi:Arc/MetJ-type ribon-helix-helix transcriptional regulator
MAKTKVAVTLDAQVLRRVDRLVREARYPNRSQAIEAAIASRLDRLECRRLIVACALLNPEEERLLAEEGLETDLAAWPEYEGARFAGRI